MGVYMRYNLLGRTGIRVSEFGLGTAQIGGPSLINGQLFGSLPISEKEAFNVLAIARDTGINFFDSSDMYGDGLAEERLGRFFKGDAKIIIATKCGIDQSGNRRFDRKYVLECVENSLKRLRRDHLDLFQFSKAGSVEIEKENLLETVSILKEQGKIIHAGISIGNVEEGVNLIHQDKWDSLQIIYNLLTLEFKGLLNLANRSGLGTIIRSPLSSGMLTGKFNEETIFPDSDDRSVYLYGELLAKRVKMVKAIKKYFELSSQELILFSLNFLLSDPDIQTIIPGASSSTQLKHTIKAVETSRFTKAQYNEVFEFVKDIAADNSLTFRINY
jgi:aryl-alcohol dehydrogenase-like predicted oxidoreductase